MADNNNVCKDQETFNEALKTGFESMYEEKKVSTGYMLFYFILATIFLFWALVLSYQCPKSANRILHILFALLASPLYVLSYYLNCLGK